MLGFLSLLPLGRRRPSVRAHLGGIAGKLMSLQQTIDTLAADTKLNAQVTAQTAAVAAATAVAVKAIGETVSKLAEVQGVDTTAADAALDGVGEHLTTLLQTTGQTGATLPGTDAAPAAGTTQEPAAGDQTGAATEQGASAT